MTGETRGARVTVIGRIDTGDGAPDIIRKEYSAQYTYLSDGFALEYDETEPPAHVLLTYAPGHARLERSGEPECRLDFIQDKRLEAAYILPEGEFSLETECQSLTLENGDARGILRIAYRLFSAGALMSENKLLLSFFLC